MSDKEYWEKYDRFFFIKYGLKTERLLMNLRCPGMLDIKRVGSYGRVYYLLSCLYKLGVKL